VNNPNYPPVSGEVTGKFTVAAQNFGVAQYTAFTAVPSTALPSNCATENSVACIALGRITYSGTDYVLPYVADTQLNSYNLNTATLQNAFGEWEEATAQAAYADIPPPQSSKNGQYCGDCIDFGYRKDPTAWVQGNSPDSPIADPSASGAYPLIGTANWVACTCYHSRDQEKSLAGVMSYISDAAIYVDLEKASWQPPAWRPCPNNGAPPSRRPFSRTAMDSISSSNPSAKAASAARAGSSEGDNSRPRRRTGLCAGEAELRHRVLE
jgi:hypothetical protein